MYNKTLGRKYGQGSGKGGKKRLFRVMCQQSNSLNRIREIENNIEAQNSIPLQPFHRLARELMRKVAYEIGYGEDMRVQMGAILAMREAVEAYLVRHFELCSLFVSHGRRVTLMSKDMQLAKRIKLTDTDGRFHSVD